MTDKYINIITTWNSKTNLFKTYKFNKNTIKFNIHKIKFTLTLPTNYSEYFLIETNPNLEWVDNINFKSTQRLSMNILNKS